ncbi:hypothetical protein Rsub_02088 [Raphidocelis subcapitata]|uniref:Uncharacterized protein n=1 Tax=Raphidocelis subcapitata TaxID=307507 RepID=A0A2V0NPI6_9CHLO|nr:hypothetical protein Rsub_02088 [Raphidocelis subcapitata]|eukprot:GBF89516.1 hypothetical protein Rsub_02088 [Raphidocelis subcapitata]
MAAFDALQALAARQAAEGNPLQAIKCLEACLRLSLMPADEAQTRLRAARLLLLHTSNLAEARQHLQKAQMVVQKLPAHHILKCEVAALLGRAHKCLGEVDYQRGAYERGLDVCQRALSAGAGGADSATRAKLQRWACYFHVRAADALASQADSAAAAAAAQRGVDAAREYGLRDEELVLRVFQLQLAMVSWDCAAVDAAAHAVTAALGGGGGGGGDAPPDSPLIQQLKLHFNVLQIIYSMRRGHFDQLVAEGGNQGAGSSGGASSDPAAITTMEELLSAVRASAAGQSDAAAAAAAQSGAVCGYEWLPLPAQEGLVRLLAACVLRAPGKVKPALDHVAKGLAAVDGALSQLGESVAAAAGGGGGGAGGAEWGESQLDHTQVWPARALAVLRILLLEARAQLHLLSSNFAAARADVAANAALFARFPVLLEAVAPSLHMQAALYAHAVGAFGAAVAHYTAAAGATNDGPAEAQARYYRHHSRPPNRTSHLLSRALKVAHNRLHNHQLINQLLNIMAPMRAEANDAACAQQMLTSAFTLAKGMGDINGQVASLSVLLQVYESTGQEDNAAQNRNFLAKKKADLAARLAAAEADAAQHAAVLGWQL